MINAEVKTVAGKDVVVLSTDEIKLRRPDRSTILFDFEKQFGFKPARFIVQLAPSRNNAIIIGVIDDEEINPLTKAILAEKKEKDLHPVRKNKKQ